MLCPTFPAESSCCQTHAVAVWAQRESSKWQRKAGAHSGCHFEPRGSNLMPLAYLWEIAIHKCKGVLLLFTTQENARLVLLASSSAAGQGRKLTGVDGHARVWPPDTHHVAKLSSMHPQNEESDTYQSSPNLSPPCQYGGWSMGWWWYLCQSIQSHFQNWLLILCWAPPALESHSEA